MRGRPRVEPVKARLPPSLVSCREDKRSKRTRSNFSNASLLELLDPPPLVAVVGDDEEEVVASCFASSVNISDN